jgi:hypothetical protein
MPLTDADLTVEDGTGIEDANAYASRAFVTEYHRLNGNAAWAAADEDAQVRSIIQATTYIDQRWTFIGQRVFVEQTLDWPRLDAVDRDGIDWYVKEELPLVLRRATAEYALRALSVSLAPDPTIDVDDAGRFVTMRYERVGPLIDERRYSDRRAISYLRPIPAADRMLVKSGLVTSTKRTVRA